MKTAEYEKRKPEQQGTGVLAKGTRLGEYEIERLIGVGSMGAVYEAVCTATGHRHAIKVLSPALAVVPTARARFRKEAELTARVRHPHIVEILDVGLLPDGSPYVVMELLRGFSLASMLKADGLIAPGFAVPMFVQVCRALWAAHQLGVVGIDVDAVEPHETAQFRQW